MIRKILKLLIILIISIFIGNIAYGIYKEFSLNDTPENLNFINTISEENTQPETKNKLIEKIEEEYKGYKVDAKLEIPKIKLNTYVFEDYDEEAMWLCPTKYFGPEPNEPGNYCIAAHNYNKENMFNHIIELEKGDLISLSDNVNGKTVYEVYDVYKTNPKNTEPLSQDTIGKTTLTLITCSDYSSKRIIVKAIKK